MPQSGLARRSERGSDVQIGAARPSAVVAPGDRRRSFGEQRDIPLAADRKVAEEKRQRDEIIERLAKERVDERRARER